MKKTEKETKQLAEQVLKTMLNTPPPKKDKSTKKKPAKK